MYSSTSENGAEVAPRGLHFKSFWVALREVRRPMEIQIPPYIQFPGPGPDTKVKLGAGSDLHKYLRAHRSSFGGKGGDGGGDSCGAAAGQQHGLLCLDRLAEGQLEGIVLSRQPPQPPSLSMRCFALVKPRPPALKKDVIVCMIFMVIPCRR